MGKKPLLYKGELKKISKALRKDAEMIELGGRAVEKMEALRGPIGEI